MEHITILEESIKKNHQKNWYFFLSTQKFLVELHFSWLKVELNLANRCLEGNGILNIGEKTHLIKLTYSPYYRYRYDRIYFIDKSLKYNDEIHLYTDLSLCLYHPRIDQSPFQKLSLYQIIPWISEWLIFYEQWCKYGVWFGKEIKHI